MKLIVALVLLLIALCAWLIVLHAPMWLCFILGAIYGNRAYFFYQYHKDN